MMTYPINPKCSKHKDKRMCYVASLPEWEEPEKFVFKCFATNDCKVQAIVDKEGRVEYR